MRLLARTAIGLALMGAVLWSPGRAEPANAQTATRVDLGIACRSSGVQGIAEGIMGDPELGSPTPFRIACGPSAPRNRGSITAIGDPHVMPWYVKLTVTDARGARNVCERRGSGLPTGLTCAVGNGGVAAGAAAQPVPEPD